MEMLMEFPNGETPNLVIEVFNYTATLSTADMLHLWMWRTGPRTHGHADTRTRRATTQIPPAENFPPVVGLNRDFIESLQYNEPF